MKKTLLIMMALMSSQAFAEGDAANGKKIAYTCTGCHGIPFYKNSYPSYSVPRLGGQNEAYLASAIKAYRSGERSHSTMQAQAGNLTDQDIADIAAYFASISKK